MKKNVYMKPEVQVTRVVTEHLLMVGSDTGVSSVKGLDEDITNGGDDPGSFSRRHGGNVWVDDEGIGDDNGY